MRAWGGAGWNIPQVMLIKQPGTRRAHSLLLMVECQRLVKSRIVCWPGQDKNTKGKGMDLNTSIYQGAF